MPKESDNNPVSNQVTFSGIDNPFIEKDKLTEEDENKASKVLRRVKRGSSLGSLAFSVNKLGQSSKVARNLGHISTAADALEKGRGVAGAGRAVALSAAKKKIISQIIKEVGLSDLMYQVNTIRQGKMVADMLNEKAKEQPTTAFFLALFFAIPKDILDIISIETLSWIDWIIPIINLFLWAVLFFFFFGKGVRWRLKIRLYIVQLIASIFEIIPLTGAIPTWTLSCLYGYFRSKREAKELYDKADQINKTLEKKI